MTELLLDLDGRAVPRVFWRRLRHAVRTWQLRVEHVRYDRTRRGWHVIVRLRETLDPVAIVAAQAILGSDPKREIFNLLRVDRLGRTATFWRTRWNTLYSRHDREVRLA